MKETLQESRPRGKQKIIGADEPLRSMTGYAVNTVEQPGGQLTFELRAVNSRFLDLTFRMGEDFRSLEPMLRSAIGDQVKRGKLECRINFAPRDDAALPSGLNTALMSQLQALSRAATESFPDARPLAVHEILRWPGMGRTMVASLSINLGVDTLVVFLSDHGMSFPFSKATVYRNGTWSPVLLRWPGMGAPQRREEFVSSVDVVPTLLELLASPDLAESRQPQHRYNAACAAALAAAGQGKDEPAPDAAARTKLRQQAREWLTSELATWAGYVESGPPQAKAFIAQTLQHWKQDSDLTGIRDPAALAGLPEPERATWRELWSNVDALLAKARGAASDSRPPPATLRELPENPFAP